MSVAPVAPAVDVDAHTRLTQLIVELELEPGSLVSEGSLTSLLGCSKPELREAVLDLRESGLVSVVPRAGILITPVGMEDVRHVFESRLAIEVHCARMAAIRAVPSDVERLQSINDRLSEVTTDAGDWGMAYVAIDREMHEAVAATARNPILEKMLGRLLVANARIWNLFFRRMAGQLPVSHQDTVDAIRDRDPDAAEQTVRHHLRYSSRMLGGAFDPLLGDTGPAVRTEAEGRSDA